MPDPESGTLRIRSDGDGPIDASTSAEVLTGHANWEDDTDQTDMKISIPDTLKADLPQNFWAKIFAATPIVMTVIATMLAGLSTSEMTRAQYDRSLAAQEQSKAGDQWAYFQAKRMRETVHRDTLLVLDLQDQPQPLADPTSLRTLPPASWTGAQAWVRSLDQLAGTQSGKAAFGYLCGKSPSATPAAALDPRIQQAETAVEKSAPESSITKILMTVPDTTIAAALGRARDRVQQADTVSKPVGRAIDRLGALLGSLPPNEATHAARVDFEAARLRYLADHYVIEAADNQRVALLLELQVRKGNLSAERHHERSQQFFVGMLAAQVAVIVSTFAMAARQKSLLWGIAAAAGVIALILSAYVYVYV